MSDPKQEAINDLTADIAVVLNSVRAATFDACIAIIEHEISLTGDGEQCLKRIRRLAAELEKPAETVQ